MDDELLLPEDTEYSFQRYFLKQRQIKRSYEELVVFPQSSRKTTEQVEWERHRFPKPQRTRRKWRMIKKENIWWAERSARTRQSHVSGTTHTYDSTHIPKHTHTHTKTFIHACTLQTLPAPELANKQKKKKKKKKKIPPHTHTHKHTYNHTHARTLHSLWRPSRTAGCS